MTDKTDWIDKTKGYVHLKILVVLTDREGDLANY